MMKKAVILLLAVVLACPLSVFGQGTGGSAGSDAAGGSDGAANPDSAGLNISSGAAVLIDGKTGAVLYEKNAHEELPPASVTKIMSMLLVLEAEDRGQIALEDKVTISDRAAEMGGSQMYMEPGEQHTVEELLKGAAMASANDACVALAEFVAGSETAFVELMNTKAEELGMMNTHFENTNGLPVANHYSSAYDIALMSKELMEHEEIRPWLTTWMDTITVGLEGKQKEFGLTNTNKLIKQYTGATGIKTGYTADAKFCLSGSAERGNMELIGVILAGETSDKRFAEMRSMLDYGFAVYDCVTVGEKDVPIGTVTVEKGAGDTIHAVLPENVDVLIKKEEKKSVTSETVVDKSVEAPVKKGDKLGEMRVLKDGKVVETYPLVADTDVERWKLSGVIKGMMEYSFVK